MIVSLIRTIYFLRLKAENTAVTLAGHDYIYLKFSDTWVLTSLALTSSLKIENVSVV